jgi:uncharacterized membrane protein
MYIAHYIYEVLKIFLDNNDNWHCDLSTVSATTNLFQRIRNMWGCNFYSDIPFVRSLLPYGFFSLLLWVALIIALVFVLTRIFRQFRNPREGNIRDSKDSLEFLKIRYAKGEIGHEDYIKMKQILSQS